MNLKKRNEILFTRLRGTASMSCQRCLVVSPIVGLKAQKHQVTLKKGNIETPQAGEVSPSELRFTRAPSYHSTIEILRVRAQARKDPTELSYIFSMVHERTTENLRV